MKKYLLPLIASLCCTTGAQAAVTYTYDQPTECGIFCYGDPNNTKLTDGNVGRTGWAINSGQDWVGWLSRPRVNIDFNLGAVTSVNTVSVGSTQENYSDVVLPSFEVYELQGSSWVLKGRLNIPYNGSNDRSAIDASDHLFYTLGDLNIQSQYVRLSVLGTVPGTWSMVDEVLFNDVPANNYNPTPEPGTASLLLAGLGVLGWKRRRKA